MANEEKAAHLGNMEKYMSEVDDLIEKSEKKKQSRIALLEEAKLQKLRDDKLEQALQSKERELNWKKKDKYQKTKDSKRMLEEKNMLALSSKYQEEERQRIEQDMLKEIAKAEDSIYDSQDLSRE